MPSRKQRRRRQKERRHEYEVVYVDDEGREVEPPPQTEEKSRTARDQPAKAAKGKQRPLREYQPPSWKRSARRALLFFPLFFIVFSIANKRSSVEWRLLSSAVYTLLFIPLTYMMDRMAYRGFQRRSQR
jgi:hypothetical protein